MNPHLIIFFVALPMLAGILALLCHDLRFLRRLIGFVFLSLNVVFSVGTLISIYQGPDQAGLILVSQMGNWPAPFGITIAVDLLSALMLAVGSVTFLCVFIYCVFQLDDRHEGSFFHALYHFLIFGVQWSFITGDLFNLFVAFEILLMASYAILVIGTSKAQIRSAYKYVLLNLFGSTMLVTCCGLLYGQVGTLNMADLARITASGDMPTNAIPIIAMLIIVFGGKAAIFPLWFWLPDTYPTLPPALAGLFAATGTKVGAYVMIRVFVMMFGTDERIVAITQPALLLIAGVTMFVGVLGAVSMHTVRRILSIHIISQIGYIVMGVGLGVSTVRFLDHGRNEEALVIAVAGAIFFILHNMVVKCVLFLCGGIMMAHAGSDDLEKIGGLVKKAPWLAVLFFLAAMSLAGLPPFSGFFGKFMLIKEGWNSAHYVVVSFAVLTSLFTLLSMLKIWSYGFWSPPKGRHVQYPNWKPRIAGGMTAIVLLVIIAISMGPFAKVYVDRCLAAARSIVDPTAYITAVLGPDIAATIEPRRLMNDDLRGLPALRPSLEAEEFSLETDLGQKPEHAAEHATEHAADKPAEHATKQPEADAHTPHVETP